MNRTCFVTGVCLLACLVFAPSAFAAAKFEAIALPNSAKVNAALFRIEVATGAVVSVWGNGSTQFFPSADKTPLPAGEYHLYSIVNSQADGTVYWSIYRMESNSGRMWNLVGGGDQPYVWVEVTAMAAPAAAPAAK